MEAHEKDFYTTMLGQEPSEALVAKHDKALLMADRAGMDHLPPSVCLLLAVDEADEEVMTAEDAIGFSWHDTKLGTAVAVMWRGKERKGKLVEIAGGKDLGKLRIKLYRDPDKKEYREIAAGNVRLA